jgi:hypothetical protein
MIWRGSPPRRCTFRVQAGFGIFGGDRSIKEAGFMIYRSKTCQEGFNEA